MKTKNSMELKQMNWKAGQKARCYYQVVKRTPARS